MDEKEEKVKTTREKETMVKIKKEMLKEGRICYRKGRRRRTRRR
jgi:hypothetical protein